MTDLLDAPPPQQAPEPRPPARGVLPSGARGQSAGRVIAVGALAFALAALLNSETLEEMADRQPFGWKRDVAVAATGALHTVARWTLLDRPGEWFDEVRGLNRDAPVDLDELVASATTVPTTGSPPGSIGDGSGPSPVAGQPPSSTPATDPGDGPATTAAPVVTSPPGPTPLRWPTSEDPLRVLVMGDSMAQGFGTTFERYLTDTGVMRPTSFYKSASGLSRPDYFDWPAEIAAKTTAHDPEVVVLMFGANDAQKLKLDGTIYDVTDGPWQAEYARRVGAVMDYLTNSGKRVVWVGLPVMEDGGFDARMRVLDAIYREQAAVRPSVTYVETRALFSNSSGGYAAYLPNDDGEPKLMRAQDGVHFSLAGAARLSSAVLDTVRAMLPPPPP